jgi:hypothetical protein
MPGNAAVEEVAEWVTVLARLQEGTTVSIHHPARRCEPVRPHQAAQPASGRSCAAQHESSSRRLFGIVGDGQSHWQPLLRESMHVMELAGLDTEWLLDDLLAYAEAVYA